MSLQSRNLRRQRRSVWGFTLMEMLIVIAIMLLLVIATLPRLKQALEDSKVRESSRQLSSYFSMAKSRAAATGRPCGVWLVSESVGDPNATPGLFQCRELYLAETPSPYSGDFTESRVTMTAAAPNYQMNFNPAPAGLFTLVADGGTFGVRFDYKGPVFPGFRSGNQFFINGAQAPTVPPSSNAQGYTYEIIRLPQRIGSALALPQGTSVDLNYSGFGSTGINFFAENNPQPQIAASAAQPAVLLMFAPDGHVDSVSYRTWDTNVNSYRFVSAYPQGATHFLVGRPEKVLNFNVGVPPAATSNLADNQALWVSVGRLTGTVTTTENAYTENQNALLADNPNFDPMNPLFTDYLFSARKFAREQDVKGGQ